MLKRNKFIYCIILLLIGIVVIVSVTIYKNKYSKEGIYNNVCNRDNYTIYEIQKPVFVTAYIKPNWIPTKENEIIKISEVIGEVGNVKIMIESVIHRGDDIYFNFDAINFIKYDRGEILSNDCLADAFNVYNKDIKIDVVQKGFGPGSKFGFSIGIKNYELIKNGFTLEYKDSVLYGYTITDWNDS